MNLSEQLKEAISRLPDKIHTEIGALNIGVMRSWTHRLPLRYQGVLVTAIRGCDGAPKEDPSKALSRMIRRAILNPADERETLNKGGFFGFDRDTLHETILAFLHSLDQYPLHYVMHLMHASEVIAYSLKGTPSPSGDFFYIVYKMIVHTLHLQPEDPGDMHVRLVKDRVADGTTERNW